MFIRSGNKLKKLVMYLMSLSLILSAAIVIPVPVVRADTKATYYVDPVNGQDTNDGMSTTTAFRTIEHARDVVRTINANMTDDIEVKLRGGTYTLDSTLNFTEADSGMNGFNIIYSAYNGEKPVISGGRQITGWTLHDASKNIYTAYAGGDIETRQLFVNGKRATRARSTGAPSPLTFVKVSGYKATGNVLANSTIPMHNWENKSDIEFVYKNQWTAPRMGVSTITNDGTTTTFTMKQPGWRFVTNKGGTSVGGSFNSNGLPWYIENAYELLDAEGEWYLDRATDNFYYKPREGENMLTAAVVAPVLEELVKVEGANLDQKAHNVGFKGITFSYSTYLRVNGDGGLPDAQNNVLRDTVKDANGNDVGRETIINAAVNLKYAHSIKFERDIFEHLGGTGLNMYTGSQDNLVVGSVFTDISGNGIQVGDYTGLYTAGTENYAQSTDTRVILRNNDVNNSYFHKIGVEYFASTAIAASLPQDMDITHNEISNVPYSGIHVGWGWDLFPKTVHQRTNIQYNYIHDDMMVLADGGAIYTNGPTNGSSTNKGMISNNYIQNEWNTNGALYPDEGSSWYDITDNVVNNSSRYLLIWKNTIHDIHVNNTYTTTPTFRNDGTNTKVTNTTVVSDGKWPSAALAIMDQAGIEAGYKDIIPLRKLIRITAPAPVSAAIGSEKTAAALGLPGRVALVTDADSMDASVTWDLNRVSYDPTVTTAQNFTVTGEVTLPERVQNPNNVPLTISISVSVDRISTRTAVVTASSTYSGDYAPNKAFDGIIGPKSEWASKGEKNPWIQVNWTTSQTFNKIIFYDRPNLTDWAPGGTLTFSDGSTLTVSGIPNDGSAYSVTFPNKTVTWVKFQVSGGSGSNVGLSEMEFVPETPLSRLTSLQQVNPGQTFDVTMGLSNVTESVYQQMYAQDLTLHYDPTNLKLDSVTSLTDGFEIIDQKESVPGHIRIVAASVGENQGVPAQGDMLKFKFTVKSETKTTDTTISVGNVIIANGMGNELVVGGATHELQIIAAVDKSLLNAAIASAQAKHDAAVEGKEHGLYVNGSKAQLQSAIDAARATASDPNATQQQVDSAKAALEAAIQVFESKKISADVNGKDGITIGDLAIVAAVYGKQEGQPGWNPKADVNHDGKVDIEDLAIVAKAILKV